MKGARLVSGAQFLIPVGVCRKTAILSDMLADHITRTDFEESVALVGAGKSAVKIVHELSFRNVQDSGIPFGKYSTAMSKENSIESHRDLFSRHARKAFPRRIDSSLIKALCGVVRSKCSP
jgi:hypothetical protein